jgi:hypothetical protein
LREADQLHRQVFQLLARGQARQALPLAQRVRDLRRPLLGETNALYATSLQYLAAAYLEAGEPARALPLYERVRDLRRQVLTENHPDSGRDQRSVRHEPPVPGSGVPRGGRACQGAAALRASPRPAQAPAR